MSVNSSILVGRVTRDPELKYTKSGNAVVNMTIAVDRNVSKEAAERVDFIPCVMFQKQAEFAANYLRKGRLVSVEGRIQVRKYQTNEGQTRTATEVVVNRIQGLDRPKEETPAAAAPAEDTSYSEYEEFEDEDPLAG